MDRIENCISFLAGKAAQQVSRRAREKLAPHGVTPVQYAALRVLFDEDGQSGAQIGARLVIDSATITGIIDRLEAAGLLERRFDADDRRVHRAFLTTRGRALQKPLDGAMDELNAEIAGEMGTQESAALWASLRRLGEVKT